MEKQIIYLDGKKIRSARTFGRLLKDVLFLDEKINVASFDVLSDVLAGGYGILNYNEPYTIIWQSYNRSEKNLDPKLKEQILNLFENHPLITLILEVA